jgi:hypothetical protein
MSMRSSVARRLRGGTHLPKPDEPVYLSDGIAGDLAAECRSRVHPYALDGTSLEYLEGLVGAEMRDAIPGVQRYVIVGEDDANETRRGAAGGGVPTLSAPVAGSVRSGELSRRTAT